MKKSVIPSFILVLSILVIISCQDEESKISQATQLETEAVKKIGQNASMQLLKTLKSELTSAIETSGIVGAIGVCSEKATILTNNVVKHNDKIISMKRTTNKFRNPVNIPDQFEQKALNYFENYLMKNDSLPQFYIQKIVDNKLTYFKYYQPISIAPLCLNCHGDKNNMNETVLAAINEKYPADKATGFNLNDFRGLVSVTIKNIN